MQITIIGSGNTATVLGRLIKDAGHDIVQVYSRNKLHAEDLAEQLEAEAVSEWGDIHQGLPLYLVALSDSGLTGLPQNWHANSGLVVHTAGSVSKNVLQSIAKNYGVIYPLQSLRKEKNDYESIPLLTDANTADNLAMITDFAEGISHIVRHANDEERMNLHVAAVVVNNFSNYLFGLAEAFCKRKGTNFDLLKPLILETAERIKDFPPAMMQTGPAARGDMATIERHLQLLQDFPELLRVYKQLTDNILMSKGGY